MNKIKILSVASILLTFTALPALAKTLTVAKCELITSENISEPKMFSVALHSGAGIVEEFLQISETEKLKVELKNISQDVLRYSESIVTISYVKDDMPSFASSGKNYASLIGNSKNGEDFFNLNCKKEN